ncbi:MAG: hypothetical protein QOD07_175 [Frankiaceae bacterium]|jgi:hypothetical protein|nr:hypothetical protein [Frankiaceae bacterium]
MPRATVAAAVLAALAVLAGVGCSGTSSVPGSVGPSPSPSITVPGGISATGPVPADYLARADKICIGALAELQRRGPAPLGPTDPRRLTAKQLRAAAPYLDRGAYLQGAAARAVRALPPPPAGADGWGVYRAAVGQYADGAQAEASAAKAGDVPGFLAAAQRLLAVRTKVLDSGLAVGLGAGTACARLF